MINRSIHLYIYNFSQLHVKLYSDKTDIPENTFELLVNRKKRSTGKEISTKSLDWSLDVLSCILDQLDSTNLKDVDCKEGCQTEDEHSGIRNALSCFNPKCFAKCELFNYNDCNNICLTSTISKKLPESEKNTLSFKSVLLLVSDLLATLGTEMGENTTTDKHSTDTSETLEMLPYNSHNLKHEIINFQASPEYSSDKRRQSQKGEVEKRYRLGLYDCISSYCSLLAGKPRKACVVNFCHRESQIEE